MEDSEERERELEVDGQVSDNNLVAKFEQQQEEEDELPDAAVADDQNPGKTRSEDEKPDEEVPEDQELNENVAEVQVPVELPVHKAHRPEDPNTATATGFAEGDAGPKEVPENKDAGPDTHSANQHEPLTPNSLVELSNAKAEDECKGTSKNGLNESKFGPEKSTAGKSRKDIEEDDESGTPGEQAAFMTELESFYRERAMEFKPPRFYGKPLNCLKLWRAVIKLGGYDRITGSKLWRPVGESFHPPKTCTTISWTFRVFYEKALLDYERNKTESGELELAVAALPESATVDSEGLQANVQAPGSGRARRDAAAPAMQGRHAQRVYGYGEVGEPIIKDKTFNIMPKREKSLKSIGPLKHKRPREGEHSVKAARTETPKQLVTNVIDIGPPADWVKINLRETKDCFEVYALVPGLLREEVHVQSDPAGRLVITGQPEQPDNPWGITAFKKVVSLPARIDPLRTTAVVSLHGRLFIRVPFDQSDI